MYEDLTIGLDLEELTLHGSKGDIEEEKGRLFEGTLCFIPTIVLLYDLSHFPYIFVINFAV